MPCFLWTTSLEKQLSNKVSFKPVLHGDCCVYPLLIHFCSSCSRWWRRQLLCHWPGGDGCKISFLWRLKSREHVPVLLRSLESAFTSLPWHAIVQCVLSLKWSKILNTALTSGLENLEPRNLLSNKNSFTLKLQVESSNLCAWWYVKMFI